MIRTENLRKRFGDFEALKGIDLEIGDGELYGFIGPNGAGKTTTIRILTTLLSPSEGSAWIDGHSVVDKPQAIRSLIGYMPDEFAGHPDMTVREYLHFFAAAYGVPHKERNRLIEGLLELTDLSRKTDQMIEALSRGMRQRLALTRTLIHDPKVLILDEPASGLDPRARVEIREVLRELCSMGKTILISSHILSELAEVCTSVGILEQGTLVAQGTIADLTAKAQDRAEVWLRTEDDPRACVVLRELAQVHSAEIDEVRKMIVLHLRESCDLVILSNHLANRSIGLRYLERQDPTLEDVFLKLTAGLVQ
jgi:ABC-2 type transport system ATP-binding protein